MPTTPIELFAQKTTIPSWARTAEWDQVPAMLRRRAFFSAAIEDACVLSTTRKAIADLLQTTSKDGKLYRRDTAIRELGQLMRAQGLDTGSPEDIRNPAAEKRRALILDINRAQAQGYARFKRSSTGGALHAYPAQELVRHSHRHEPRDWRARWQANGGTLYQGRMIALKTSPIWTAISRFANPYPPFDFGSGMGVADIPRDEAITLGVIEADYTPTTDPVADFNAHTQMSVAQVDPTLLDTLATLFGTAINIANGLATFAPIN